MKGNKVSGVLTTFADITERKQAEADVEQLRRLVSTAQRAARFGVFEWYPKTGECIWPPETSELLGLDATTTKPSFDVWLQTVHPADRDEVLNNLRQSLEGETGSIKIDYRSSDGLRWMSGRGQHFHASPGVPDHVIGVCIDVTERKRLEASLTRTVAALESSEFRYRLMFNSVSDAIFVFAVDGGLIEVNDRACQHLGYTRLELLEKRYGDIVTPELGLELPALVQRLQTEGQLRYEGNDTAKDGRRTPVEIVTQLIELNGSPVVMSCVRDITERHRMLGALQASEEKFSKAFLSSPAITTISDLSKGDRILEVNEAFEELTGYRRDEVIGRTSTELGLWADPGEFDEAVRLFQANGRIRNFEYHFRKKDGEIRLGLISADVVFIDGQPCPIASTIDITELRSTERTIRELATAIEQADEAIVIADLSGTIQYCNPAASRTTGYTKQELLGQNPRVLKSGRQDSAFYEQLWRTLTQGDVWTGRFTNRRKDGSLYEEAASISPIRDGSGRLSGFVAVKRDISDRLKMEAQLLQAQKLEGIGRLAGGVAHDFNNLLTVINGYAGFLLRGLPESDPSREYLLEIKDAGASAAGLTKQLLAFSRKQLVEPVVLDLNAAIRDYVPMLRRLIGEDIALETRLEDPLGSVMADIAQIHQVIMNLAVNARDAMPAGGTLTIATTNAEQLAGTPPLFPDAVPGQYVLMSVTDSGQGIEESIRQQIFEPFFTTKGPAKGTGLGLSTVYGIVRQNGGWIDLKSEVGVGTSFTIYLPRIAESKGGENAESALTAATRRAPKVVGGSETILIVEDQDAVRTLAKRMLETCGYVVMEARNGEAALKVASRSTAHIDLLLTDVVMPGMNGKTLSLQLQTLRPGIKVLFISGYTADVITNTGVLDRDIALLHKPFTPEQLAEKVREVLATPSPSGPA